MHPAVRILIRSIVFFTLAIGCVPPSYAEICQCDSQIVDQVPIFDMAVRLTNVERIESIERHLPWGIPRNPINQKNEFLIIQRHFIVNYDADLNTATWVAYRLTAEHVDENQPGYVKRLDCFRDFPSDLYADTTPPTCDDYDKDSFDRGHIANSNDMRRSRIANANSFFLTNMAPQYPNFNRKIWRTLEDQANKWAALKSNIYIISGAVFDNDNDGHRDPDELTKKDDGNERIAVASHFYKIIFHMLPDGSIETISILLPHNNESITGADRWPYLRDHIVAISDIENRTGINFLTELEIDDSAKAHTVREYKSPGLWPTN